MAHTHCDGSLLIEVSHDVKIIIVTIFKMYNSVAFSTFTVLYNHHHYLTPEHFHNPKK